MQNVCGCVYVLAKAVAVGVPPHMRWCVPWDLAKQFNTRISQCSNGVRPEIPNLVY